MGSIELGMSMASEARPVWDKGRAGQVKRAK
jgi:hypothetical protein